MLDMDAYKKALADEAAAFRANERAVLAKQLMRDLVRGVANGVGADPCNIALPDDGAFLAAFAVKCADALLSALDAPKENP